MEMNRRAWIKTIGASLLAISQSATGQDRFTGKGSRHPREQGTFKTEVPVHALDVILARPTDRSVTVSVLGYQDMEGTIEYGTKPGEYSHWIPTARWQAGRPQEILLESLQPNTRYYYRVRYRPAGENAFRTAGPYTFHTARPPGKSFVFTVQADSHLDEPTSSAIYLQTLHSALASRPDFHIDLGDTFMTDKYGRNFHGSADQYLAQRYYFGQLSHSSPLMLTLGNHDGEAGWLNNESVDNIAVWSNRMRTSYFPNPVPDRFFTGNTNEIAGIGLPQNYYAWHWGDALFVVLDPFWPTQRKTRPGGDGWNWTLGRQQYDWLETTLRTSDTKYKFIFIHHLVGGSGESARGGAEAAHLFEWGGCDLDGQYVFESQRPSWPVPIHELLRKYHVSAVFHGHDHGFAQQELNGIIYQLVPQPGFSRMGSTRPLEMYGYENGTILAGSGYLRIRVSQESATVDYIRAKIQGIGIVGQATQENAFSYKIPADNS